MFLRLFICLYICVLNRRERREKEKKKRIYFDWSTLFPLLSNPTNKQQSITTYIHSSSINQFIILFYFIFIFILFYFFSKKKREKKL